MSFTPNYPTVSIRRPEPIPKAITKEHKTYFLPIYIITGVFAVLFILGPIFIRKGPNAAITRCCLMITAFMLWLFWVTMYIAQMNPMMGPRLQNVTAAWLGHVWGKDPKSLGDDL